MSRAPADTIKQIAAETDHPRGRKVVPAWESVPSTAPVWHLASAWIVVGPLQGLYRGREPLRGDRRAGQGLMRWQLDKLANMFFAWLASGATRTCGVAAQHRRPRCGARSRVRREDQGVNHISLRDQGDQTNPIGVVNEDSRKKKI